MFAKLKALFKKNNYPEPREVLKQLSINDLVELKFHHPKKIGFNTDDCLTLTRLNINEASGDRVVRGNVLRCYKDHNLLREWIIEISSSMTLENNQAIHRKYIFLEEEIECIRKLN